ncbi:hypothetical protein AJ80_09089 [Polytolypa hystricis UAMH7299]|uniref:Uncharacterized protein n=1 Tax=Polytolypa hystricis (strain UAMH7299) TaxID=1447883 RepID=A0A2B7WWJ5_POLH7|nr:hypothetical protein AJ80_09089 [Polytolypa hystricis UAMH7299]
MATMSTYIVFLILLVHLVGLNAMYGLVLRNGYIEALIRLRDVGPHVLPGSNNPILKRYTLIPPLDKLLTLATVMFANITDGSTPQSSLYAFQFAGQLVPIFTIMVIEGLRSGNRRGVLSVSFIWGCLTQCAGYGFLMPLYTTMHLLTSATAGDVGKQLANAIRVSDVQLLDALPQSLILGYVVPSILMSIPVGSSALHQWLMGFWQGVPVWVILLQYVFRSVSQKQEQAGSETQKTCGDNRHTRSRELHALKRVYYFAFAFATACQLATYAILGIRLLYPTLFSPHLRDTLTFSKVFIQPPIFTPGKMESMATGIHNFFQYDQYIGSLAALIWAVRLEVKAREYVLLTDGAKLIAEIVGLSVMSGPAGAFILLIWQRDQKVYLNHALA